MSCTGSSSNLSTFSLKPTILSIFSSLDWSKLIPDCLGGELSSRLDKLVPISVITEITRYNVPQASEQLGVVLRPKGSTPN